MAEPEGSGVRRIPPVNEVVESAPLEAWRSRLPRTLIVEAAQAVLAAHRRTVADANGAGRAPGTNEFAHRVAQRLTVDTRPPLGPVVNATGIIIHTGLGRAPLAPEAVAALTAVAAGYAPVELDLETGERGSRATVVRELLCSLTGAESATVVNNTAAAMMLVLATLADGREVIVSRGELIEIGGSFRLPEVMSTGGSILREVGTTNKTRLGDYEQALGDATGAILKVHPSNYRIDGFTESVGIDELARLGADHGVPVVHDIGSGALVDLAAHGIGGEPYARASIEAGADLVLFSGDKLLGGPQAGIIAGRRELVGRIERHPMMRALRLDKLILAALAVTLQLHRDPETARRQVPVLAMATADVAELERRAQTLAGQLREIEGTVEARVTASTAYVGGGSLPTHGVPSAAVGLRAAGMAEGDLARRLRPPRGDASEQPVLARVHDGLVWLDLRTVFPGQDAAIVARVRSGLEAPDDETGQNARAR